MIFEFSVLIAGLAALWLSSGIIVSSMDKIAHRLHLSSFIVSFFLLGFATSVPELSVGVNSILENQPSVFVGNYVGGAIAILLLILPVLAILGNGIDLNHKIRSKDLLASLLVIGLPAAVTINGSITFIEGLICALSYVVLYFFLDKSKHVKEYINWRALFYNHNLKLDLLKVTAGVVVVFFASDVIVTQVIKMSDFLGYSAFIVSLILLAVGTNLPEFSIAIRAVVQNKKSIAFGNYLGSASFHTFLMGLMTISYPQPINIGSPALPGLGLFFLGLAAIYFFVKSDKYLSRQEGLVLLMLYFLIITTQLVLAK